MKLILLLLSLTAHAQTWEKMPKVGDQHYAVFTYKVKSYVQLPGDSIEYQTLGIYVQLLPKVGHEIKIRSEQTRAINDHVLDTRAENTKIYLGDYLKPTGRKFKVASEAVRRDLTMMDKMLNRENNFER